MNRFTHSYPFDPSYGYDLQRLLAVTPPETPADFAEFWRRRYRRALAFRPCPLTQFVGNHAGFDVYDIRYQSTDGFTIGGWLLLPCNQVLHCGIVVGHGYGGRDAPDFDLGIPGTALLFPCFRGLSRSHCQQISDQPQHHVLHDIDNPEHYILGGCVDDVWLAVTVLLGLYPTLAGRIGYMGISFGGGIGAMAAPWDSRIDKVHLNIPSFGQQPLRLQLPSIGSAAAVQDYHRQRGNALATLQYYDAAVAAGYASQPLHIAAALFDPVVAPPGQFAVYNAWSGKKSLFVLEAGHFDYPHADTQVTALKKELYQFFTFS